MSAFAAGYGGQPSYHCKDDKRLLRKIAVDAKAGAGYGNRTRVLSLGSSRTTTVLIPQTVRENTEERLSIPVCPKKAKSESVAGGL